jgi:hypothetical protein
MENKNENKRIKNVEYQKEYYRKHKTDLLSSACSKVKCTLCDREVIKNNINKHKLSKICENTRKRNLREKQILSQV